MAKKEVSKLLEVARKMPPLYHTLPEKEFSIENSEMAQWMMQQPEILQYIANRIKDGHHIVYNRETGKWQGVDFDGAK